jgi:hypothetical protein
MNEKTDQLSDWEFKVDEISANVYRVTCVDRKGSSVERTGTDPEMLLSECRADAMKLSERNKEQD